MGDINQMAQEAVQQAVNSALSQITLRSGVNTTEFYSSGGVALFLAYMAYTTTDWRWGLSTAIAVVGYSLSRAFVKSGK